MRGKALVAWTLVMFVLGGLLNQAIFTETVIDTVYEREVVYQYPDACVTANVKLNALLDAISVYNTAVSPEVGILRDALIALNLSDINEINDVIEAQTDLNSETSAAYQPIAVLLPEVQAAMDDCNKLFEED